MSLPRQDSTTDQLDDVARWADEAGCREGAAWVRAWDDYGRPISDEDLRVLRRLAVERMCYDARDAIDNRAGRRG